MSVKELSVANIFYCFLTSTKLYTGEMRFSAYNCLINHIFCTPIDLCQVGATAYLRLYFALAIQETILICPLIVT